MEQGDENVKKSTCSGKKGRGRERRKTGGKDGGGVLEKYT